MECVFELGKVEAVRFLRSIPSSANSKSVFYVVKRGNSLSLTQQPSKESVQIAGLARFKVLADLAPLVDRMRIFMHPSGDATAWQLEMGPNRFCITLSPDVWRGFSGEGQALTALASKQHDNIQARTRAALKWQACIDAAAVASDLKVKKPQVEQALKILGASGLVGFDLLSNSYFHRELPFQIEKIGAMNPRLKNANKLLDGNAVQILCNKDGTVESEVENNGVTYRIRIAPDRTTCSCVWFSKHQGKRGVCKHILATQMFLENEGKSNGHSD